MRLPPLEKDGRGGNFATGFARRSACRKADSTNSDMVCPRLAASSFTARIVASLIESVVFIQKTICTVWFSVKCADAPPAASPGAKSCQKTHSGRSRGCLRSRGDDEVVHLGNITRTFQCPPSEPV